MYTVVLTPYSRVYAREILEVIFFTRFEDATMKVRELLQKYDNLNEEDLNEYMRGSLEEIEQKHGKDNFSHDFECYDEDGEESHIIELSKIDPSISLVCGDRVKISWEEEFSGIVMEAKENNYMIRLSNGEEHTCPRVCITKCI